MSYFVTGGTGFIGQNLIELLLKRRGQVYVLVRKGSEEKLEKLKLRAGKAASRIVPVSGDLTRPYLGIGPKMRKELQGKVRHFFHCGAIYDLKADAASQEAANVGGTRNAVRLAEAIKAGRFHHVSSIAAAGLYPGIFTEDMFDEAMGLDNAYFRTKHESEGVVRHECKIPWRVYRPGIVVGNSETGEIDKIDGPYYFFKLIQKLRKTLPPWMPAIGLEGGRHQYRAGGFRGQGHGPYCPPAAAGRQVLPPDRPQAQTHRQRPEYLCAGRPRAADEHAFRCPHVQFHPVGGEAGHDDAAAGAPDLPSRPQ